MRQTIQFRIFRGETQYAAECLDLPVTTQAPTLDELAENIREAVALYLEDEDLTEHGLAADPAIFVTMELEAVVKTEISRQLIPSPAVADGAPAFLLRA